MTLLAFPLHISAGFVALVAGSFAIVASKGSHLHRRAGNVFVASMLVMATFAVHLSVVMPGQLVNVFIAVFASYLIVTAWLTVRREQGTIGAAEKVALVSPLPPRAVRGTFGSVGGRHVDYVQERGAVKRSRPHRDLWLQFGARDRRAIGR